MWSNVAPVAKYWAGTSAALSGLKPGMSPGCRENLQELGIKGPGSLKPLHLSSLPCLTCTARGCKCQRMVREDTKHEGKEGSALRRRRAEPTCERLAALLPAAPAKALTEGSAFNCLQGNPAWGARWGKFPH